MDYQVVVITGTSSSNINYGLIHGHDKFPGFFTPLSKTHFSRKCANPAEHQSVIVPFTVTHQRTSCFGYSRSNTDISIAIQILHRSKNAKIHINRGRSCY